jgi:cytoskeletal protein RodZ
MMGAGAVLLVVCVMAAAMLLAARESSVPAARTTSAATEPQTSAAASEVSGSVAAPVSMARSATSASTENSASAKSSAVTITGCLQRGGEAFRLTDTDGSDAPRARSWKTGFLKKGRATIEVTDAANRLRMASHVGQRVSVTGLLEDRQMQARSLRRIAPACE